MFSNIDFRKKRRERRIGIREAARSVGVSKSTLQDFERGKTNPFPLTLRKIIRFYERLGQIKINPDEVQIKRVLRRQSIWDDLIYRETPDKVILFRGKQ